MLAVQRGNIPPVGASLLPLQPVERISGSALERSGEGHKVDSGQMPTCVDVRAVFHVGM